MKTWFVWERAGLYLYLQIVYPLPKQQILDSSKLKELADDNCKFDENGRKFSKPVGNTVGRGKIAHYEQFLLFYSVFKRRVMKTHKNQGLFGKGLNQGQNGQYAQTDQGQKFLLLLNYLHLHGTVYLMTQLVVEQNGF